MFPCNYKEYDFDCEVGTMTPCQYKRMIDLLENNNLHNICELGSGQSTRIFKTYCKKRNAIAFSIENDTYYNIYDSIMMPLKEKTSFAIDDKIFDKCTYYYGFEDWLKEQDKFDFVLIDGPNDVVPHNYKSLYYSKIQTLSFILLDKLNNNSFVLIHDSERDEAQRTLEIFETLLSERGYGFLKEIITETDEQIIEYNKKYLNVCPELTIYKIINTNYN